MSPRRRPLILQRALHTKWDYGLIWILWVWIIPRSEMWRGYIFIRSCMTGIFQSLESDVSDSSHKVIIDIPYGTKVIPSLAEMMTGQNPSYKVGGTKKVAVSVEKKNGNIPNFQVACRWFLKFTHYHWIG